DNLLCYSKSTDDGSNTILTVVNLDPKHEQSGWLDLRMDKLDLPWQGSFEVEDLLTGVRYSWKDQWNYVALKPGRPAHVLRIVR
ncbi:MAG TPA: alpha-1,4-glucan--maltose-1-phosphate maltosyltransferase, partial [Acidobacteriaceae bacterium]